MVEDMNLNSSKYAEKMKLLNEQDKDRKELLSLYVHDHAPCAVTSSEYGAQSDVDYTAIMIDFTDGFETYSKKMKDEIDRIVVRNTHALYLFLNILKLPHPASEVLYYRYYKKMSAVDVQKKLYMSRSTYFRVNKAALELLVDKYNSDEKKRKSIKESQFTS